MTSALILFLGALLSLLAAILGVVNVVYPGRALGLTRRGGLILTGSGLLMFVVFSSLLPAPPTAAPPAEAPKPVASTPAAAAEKKSGAKATPFDVALEDKQHGLYYLGRISEKQAFVVVETAVAHRIEGGWNFGYVQAAEGKDLVAVTFLVRRVDRTVSSPKSQDMKLKNGTESYPVMESHYITTLAGNGRDAVGYTLSTYEDHWIMAGVIFEVPADKINDDLRFAINDGWLLDRIEVPARPVIVKESPDGVKYRLDINEVGCLGPRAQTQPADDAKPATVVAVDENGGFQLKDGRYILLAGVDLPEAGSPLRQEALALLRSSIQGKVVNIVVERDKRGPKDEYVYYWVWLEDGSSMSTLLARAGLATVWRDHTYRQWVHMQALSCQFEARYAQHRGLWAKPQD